MVKVFSENASPDQCIIIYHEEQYVQSEEDELRIRDKAQPNSGTVERNSEVENKDEKK